MTLLAADIGGTRCRLALFDDDLRLTRSAELPSQKQPSAAAAVASFLAVARVDAAALGVPGWVLDGRCTAPNLPWTIDEGELAAALGLPRTRVRLLNDLEAAGHGVDTLGPLELRALNAAPRQPQGHGALIAAGTGLGQALLVRQADGRMRPLPSEGGHTSFAPADAQQVELWHYLSARFGHVSWDRVVSGHGLVNIFGFLCAVQRLAPTDRLRAALDAPGADAAAEISLGAMQHHEALCEQALDLFIRLYAQEAANLALKTLAFGGLFVAGGIALRLVEPLADGRFMRAFVQKGRLQPVLEQVPVLVVLDAQVALIGAARVAQSLLDSAARKGASR